MPRNQFQFRTEVGANTARGRGVYLIWGATERQVEKGRLEENKEKRGLYRAKYLAKGNPEDVGLGG